MINMANVQLNMLSFPRLVAFTKYHSLLESKGNTVPSSNAAQANCLL